MNQYSDDGILPGKHNLESKEVVLENKLHHRALSFMALMNVGTCGEFI